MQAWSFYRLMPVYLRSGRLLGRVLEVGHAVDVLHVQQGRRLITDWYVPIDAVRGVTGDGVYLTVDRTDLRRCRWNVPTDAYLARQGATVGYEYTGRANIPPNASSGTETASPPTGKADNG